MDISLTQDETGDVIMHRPDCRTVATHRLLEKPILTMFGVETIPLDVKRCICMTGPEYPPDHPAPGDLGSIPL